MKVYINKITGLDDAMVSLLMSKRSWTRDKEQEIRDTVRFNCNTNGWVDNLIEPEFERQMEILIKWGKLHTTLLRFIDISITVEGLHRGGQDDWDSHAKRIDNRIVRSSTRLANFKDDEKSEWYKEKIKYPFEVLTDLGIQLPEQYTDTEGNTFVKSDFGYVREGMENNRDVRRGLYPLAIPSNFIFKVQYPELCHIIQHRDINSGANPEVKFLAELIREQLTDMNRWLGENLDKVKMQK